ncbi:hypothetical protein V8C40DRAFT_239282 [Trichoderma camerunense]
MRLQDPLRVNSEHVLNHHQLLRSIIWAIWLRPFPTSIKRATRSKTHPLPAQQGARFEAQRDLEQWRNSECLTSEGESSGLLVGIR